MFNASSPPSSPSKPLSALLPPTDSSEPLSAMSLLRGFRNRILSWTVPIDVALFVKDKFSTPLAEQGVFKRFMEELKQRLEITGGSPDFVAKLIPEYLTQVLKAHMSTGDMLAFQETIEKDLTHAYDETLPEITRNEYKSRVLKSLMLKMGPHGLKYVQSLRSKEPSSWVADAISTAQSDLPAVPIKHVEDLLKASFKTQGTMKYVDHFSDHFSVVKVLGAGTVGIAALITFKESKDSEPKELVVKIIRPGTVDAFRADSESLIKAIDILVTNKRTTLAEALSFKHFSLKKLTEELKETNPNLENAHLLERLYEGPGVTTVHGHLDLFGQSSNVVFMEKAPGIELGKHLKNIRKELASSSLSQDQRDLYLQELVKIRKSYATLIQIHTTRMLNNLSVHADLHPGNIYCVPDSGKLSVLDLGAITHPVSEQAHTRLQSFLFSIYLSAGTADAQYLRFFYQNHMKHPEPSSERLDEDVTEQLLKKIQVKLDEIRRESLGEHVIDSDKAANAILQVITNEVFLSGEKIIPSALLHLSRSSQLLTEEWDALNKDLAGSTYAADTPFLERTQMGMALKLLFKKRLFSPSILWTPELKDYFMKKNLSIEHGLEQLQYEKKFIYGIFGLTKAEASMADYIIPGAIISSPLALGMAAKVLYKTARKASDLNLSYKFLQTYKKISPEGVQPKELFKSLHQHLSNHPFFNAKSTSFSIDPLKPMITEQTKAAYQKMQHLLFKPAVKLPRQPRLFVPGLIIGAGLMYGAQKMMNP